jgi:hypothetical protein
MQSKSRRHTLQLGLLVLFWPLTGCGGGGSGNSSSDGSPVAPAVWNVPAIDLGQGAASTFNLALTLPPDIARGGVFAVDASGSTLPAGVSLSSTGILSASSQTTESVSGVIFSYASIAG